jgi:hypothetical protein
VNLITPRTTTVELEIEDPLFERDPILRDMIVVPEELDPDFADTDHDSVLTTQEMLSGIEVPEESTTVDGDSLNFEIRWDSLVWWPPVPSHAHTHHIFKAGCPCR